MAKLIRMWPGVPKVLPGTRATPASSCFSARSVSVLQFGLDLGEIREQVKRTITCQAFNAVYGV